MSLEQSAQVAFDPASFKDPAGRVFHYDGHVYRTMAPEAASFFKHLLTSGSLQDLFDDGLMVECRLVNVAEIGLDPATYGETVLDQQRVDLITYPYEWSFSMLQDAALVTLDMMERCLAKGLILKDATAYNVTFHEGRMVFIDTLSIAKYEEGRPWVGLYQFTREFLLPLMMTAYKGMETHDWQRGALSGLDLASCSDLFGLRDIVRPGVFKHIKLQNWLNKAFSNSKAAEGSSGAKNSPKVPKEALVSLVRNLRKTIRKMNYRPAHSVWVDYDSNLPYLETDTRTKADIVQAYLSDMPGGSLLVDLGCNVGRFSKLAGDGCTHVVGLDIDPACIDRFYRDIRSSDRSRYIPMVGNLLNPSPAIGWNLEERRSLFDRVRGDRFCALALIHHLCISGNIPIENFVTVLRRIADKGIVEWVDKSDPMVQKLLSKREDVFDDYTWDTFERAIGTHFEITNVTARPDGKRRLVELAAKSSSSA